MAAANPFCCWQYDQHWNWLRWLYATYDRTSEAFISQLARRNYRQHCVGCHPDSTLRCLGLSCQYRSSFRYGQSYEIASGAPDTQDPAILLGDAQASNAMGNQRVTNRLFALPA